jgi:hypothetical protein
LPTGIEKLGASGKPFDGDLFFDSYISGDVLSRPAINAMEDEIRRDKNVSHVFIPRRDRLARPDNATDGVRLENELRQLGVTPFFMDCVLSPLPKGQRQNVGEALTSFVAYDSSSRFRDERASKMLDAQINLAESGYTTDGRPPYGFRRFLISPKGEVIRELQEGEIIRQKGHHVVWLPGPDEELDVNKRIIQMIETIPACKVARI